MQKNIVFTIFTIVILLSSVIVFSASPAYADAPAAPTNGSPSGTPTETSLTIQWTAPSGIITGYKIESAPETSFNVFGAFSVQTADTGNTATTKTITELPTGQFFKFRISALHDGDTSPASSEFMAGTQDDDNQNFSGGVQNFHQGQTFGSGTQFAANQQFTGTQTFGANQQFGSGTQFAANQEFTGAQTFVGANTFGSNAKFGAGQTFGSAQTFGAGTNFTGTTTFAHNQAFGASTQFAEDQSFQSDRTFDFTGTSMDFGSGTDFGAARTFGTSMNFVSGNQTFVGANTFGSGAQFAPNQVFGSGMIFGDNPIFKPGTKFNEAMTWGSGANFTGAQTFLTAQTFGKNTVFGESQDFTGFDHNLSKFDMSFGAGSLFSNTEVFGTGASFTGIIDFPSGMAFPVLAEFQDSQTFPAGEAVTFDDFAKFGSGTSFGQARTFEEFTYFGAGNTTFVGTNTFKEGTHFGSNQKFTAPQTFGISTFFDSGTDFSSQTQTFGSGTIFDTGVSFASGQSLGSGLVPSYGLLLESITCGDAACVPSASQYLSPGELLLPGTDPAAIANVVSNKTKSFEIPGLGFEMSFANVTTSGKVNVDPMDPASIAGSSAAGTTGSRSLTASGTAITTIGTVMNISMDTAAQSGTMSITLPYEESNIPAGVAESDLKMVHYTGGQWVTENNCTVDTGNNKISCTVTSLSPFGIGAGPASSGGGSSGDKSPPSFTTTFSNDEYPLTISGTGYALDVAIPMQTITIGKSIQFELLMYEDGGSQNISHVDMYVNHKGSRVLNNLSETSITYDSGTTKIQDPSNLIESATIVSSPLGNKAHFVFDVSFANTMDISDVLFRIWDSKRNSASIHIPNVIRVVDSDSIVASDIISTDDTLPTSTVIPDDSSFTEIFDNWAGYSDTAMPDGDFVSQLGFEGNTVPKWFKQNNSKWFKDGSISHDDFIAALDNLSKRKLL